MTLQWTAIALILYAEIFIVLALLLPWIRPSRSRLMKMFEKYTNVYSVAAIAVLLLLFFDAIREVRKYSSEIRLDSHSSYVTADSGNVLHMRLFRAQRNLYICGFALLLFLVIKRLVALLSRGAQLEAAAEAAMHQAEGANKVAKSLLSEGQGEGEQEDELRRQLKEMQEQIEATKEEKNELKEKADNLREEYERLSEQLVELKVGRALV
ncbi:unnamed protein product [Anisakis simplex]|uniref:Endoplasmic reticulum transmembrane protein n=1 Tax=Anisakis simplex TaxID=6269 RepID=A0A0M3K7F9_ANISI|nr:unnamed protein product [Anisakis simplex]